MRFAHEGMSLWFESDPPVTLGAAQADRGIAIVVGVEPADASNRVEIRYRVNGGPTTRVAAEAVRHTGSAQYFSAQLPAGTVRAGDMVEYAASCRCAGRQVPSPDDLNRFAGSFPIVDQTAPEFTAHPAQCNPSTISGDAKASALNPTGIASKASRMPRALSVPPL